MRIRNRTELLHSPAITRCIALAIAVALCAPVSAAETPLAERPPVTEALGVLDLWIAEQVDHRRLPGLSIGIVHGDELVWARGYGMADVESATPATPQTLYRLGSVTKLFTATAVMQLRDRGLLRLDDPVRRHLPWFSVESDFAGEPEITIRHLLTHTSGLPREGAFPYWTTHSFPDRAALIERLPSQRAVYPPGTRYKYSNLGMALLGEVVAAVSGELYDEYLERHVFAPLGMDGTSVRPDAGERDRLATAYFRYDGEEEGESREVFEYYDTGALAPAANIVSSVDDLARFAALQFADGTAAEGAQVLRASTLREMHRPHWIRDGWRSAIGLGFRVARADDGEILVSHGGWVGGNRSHLLLRPADEIAVIVLTNADDASPSFFAHRAQETAGDAIAAAAAAEIATETAAETAAAEGGDAPDGWKRRAAAYLGTYTDPWGWETEVIVLDGALALYDHDYPPSDRPADGVTRLEPTGEPHTFRLPDGETLRFQLDTEGRVERLWKRYEYLLPATPEPPEPEPPEPEPSPAGER